MLYFIYKLLCDLCRMSCLLQLCEREGMLLCQLQLFVVAVAWNQLAKQYAHFVLVP